MVVVTPSQDVDVQCDAGGLGPAAHAVMDHLRVQRAHHRALEAEIADEKRPRGNVDDGAREGFVEGCVGVPEPGEPRAWPQSLAEGGAEREEGVFGRVMVVDW